MPKCRQCRQKLKIKKSLTHSLKQLRSLFACGATPSSPCCPCCPCCLLNFSLSQQSFHICREKIWRLKIKVLSLHHYYDFRTIMLKPYKISDYCEAYKPEWTCEMPAGCPPEDILVPSNHLFYRLASHANTYLEDDFKSYAEANPQRDWGERLPLAVGLSLIDKEAKARKNLKLPMFRHFMGIIALTLNPADGVVKQSGVHLSHYTWWRTKAFQMSNLTMLQI